MQVKDMTERFLKSTYLDKGTNYSVTTLTKPDYQLWVLANAARKGEEIPKTEYVGFKSAIGSAWHEFVEKSNEPGVIKEFSHTLEHNGVTIGGTADELYWLEDKQAWQIRDHKTKGVYSAKKFLGIGTKAFPNPPPENEKEVLQLSIYRWMFEKMFNKIDDEAIIYLWVMGHTKREQFPEVSEVRLGLRSSEETERYINYKLEVAASEVPPSIDCDVAWMCDYCDACSQCPEYTRKHNVNFSDES
jgi:hypothetical protein